MGEAETRQRLLRNVKKEVKQIMEEAVTRKFVHEDSSHIISFCGVIEACVLHGLKRRAAGFLRSNKLAALFVKVGKTFPPAETLCSKVQELEQEIESKQNQARLNQDSSQKPTKIANLTPQAIRHMWVRTALTEKVLDKIVLYLVENSSKFYEKEALLRDPVDGPILASLLVGPCALDYTKAKTANHFWTDPSADELVQRHRIHSGYCRQDSPTKRPALIRKRQSSGSMDDRPMFWARDYVESLHQNSRATLLFGKNNVLVQPTDDMEAIPGYLSLHQSADLMTLKWTPNQLMNGNMGDVEYEKSMYWDYAMTIRLEEIVYLHCHQQVDSGGTVVLVSQDGIQRPPLRFPKGGHLLQFLTCLENGLLPHGQLDPPLWSQRGKGKVFPRLRRRSPHGSCESVSDKDEDEATDYVFRILLPGSQSEFASCPSHWLTSGMDIISPPSTRNHQLSSHAPPLSSCRLYDSAPEMIDGGVSVWQPTPPRSSCSSCAQNGSADIGNPNGCNHDRAPLKLLCETMKYQIISRAFYGWLAYCRHLSTVRTHLSALVNPTIVECDFPVDASGGLSKDVWETFLQDSTAYDEQELLRLVYFGGVDSTIRKEVWPFILGHYHFTMTEKERKEVDEQVRACYEQTMSEWLGCEAIVRQREKEQHAAALAKCSSEASGDRSLRQDSTISTDSSQSSSSERRSRVCSHSDSNSSTQVFGSVDEVDEPESEAKPKDEKPPPKVPNGSLPNGTTSPDSGHPSSRNFSTTSALSDCSPSADETSAHDSKAAAPLLSPEKPKPGGEEQAVSILERKPNATPTETSPTKPESLQPDLKLNTTRESSTHQTSKALEESKVEEKTQDVTSDVAGAIGATSKVPEMETDLPQRDEYEKDHTKSPDLKETPEEAQDKVEEIETLHKSEVEIESTPKVDQAKDIESLFTEKDEKSVPSESSDDLLKDTLRTAKLHLGELSNMGACDVMTENISGPVAEDNKVSLMNCESKGMDSNTTSKQDQESEVGFSAHALTKQSPVTGDSDDSPSALQMEDIPAALIHMPPEESWGKAPLTLDPPSAQRVPRDVGMDMPILELRLDVGMSTSPEGTDSILSEDEPEMESLFPKADSLAVGGDLKNEVASPVSSIGTTYSQDLLDKYMLNLHRIEKDVHRCDRNYWYFTSANLEKLRNIMCSYVWQHLDIGYVQGMCDLLAPLLVILDDEAMAFSCFTELMKRMNQNFPHGGAMDSHFANMRSLIQILDSELFELMQQNGDYTHFYFCYRWFLLDFKREMVYDDVFSVWETIWAAKYASSSHFVLFIALALVEIYRDIILENNMDFTEIIKFFNEMAERHDVKRVLVMARDLVNKVQTLIENK
ncbi:small G protein signaling modulator 1 isoform X2 [Denticeps clupeoides]|uniref:small G protein signaling modulator 1 isoform X2 n=1 Tax=Denticeps clupeoides TaxID=299321 RepID=UPI0010A477EA|nr:small G protein signaling modulator 1-like isoform X2 [Denticeps clupeoides]